jgi:hypothetical protein
MGDLRSGDTWKAEKAILVKDGQNWAIKSKMEVDVASVWQ